jgi:hypothetical protein
MEDRVQPIVCPPTKRLDHDMSRLVKVRIDLNVKD